jgi:anti-sigma factor RsiW
MSQNQEIIEAKLCAYIDGELDAEGRVEIERHLEANPQHRRLLESLKATRDLLKWLPREAAPSEVAETLNGQLERSVLLDDESSSLGPSIWPRVFAAAAIILLTAGLFAAVYFTLPRSQKVAIPYAREGASPAAEPAPSDTDRTAVAERPESGSIAMKGGMPGKAAGGAAQFDSHADEKKPELDRLAMEVTQNRAAIAAAANGTTNGPGAAGGNAMPALNTNAMVVLVRSNSLSDTRKQLTTYLDSQKISWKQTEPESELNVAAAVPQAQQQASEQQPVQQQSIAAEQLNDRNVTRSVARLATTQPAQSDMAATVAPNALMQRQQQEFMGRTPTTQPSNFSMSPWNVTTADAAGGWYVARMSRQQCVQLSNTISQEGPQTVELKEFENNAVAPSLPPTTNESRDDLPKARGAFGALSASPPATRPSDLETSKDATAATQPAQATAETNQALDVVIVVQSAAPGTQPATEPANVAPATPTPPQTQPAQPGNP